MGRKDIAASADQLQAMVDEVIKMATNYLNIGEGVVQVQKMLENVTIQAQALFGLMQQSVPAGIHPDDWEWIERVKAEERNI